MFCAFFLFALFSLSVWAIPQNATIDDQDFSKITYTLAADWDHFPLVGWENDFYNRSRSYTWIPGANATFTFTGYGIWVQGPSAPDQAQRRVFLDGIDMGAYNAKADDRSPSRPFWGKDDLEYTTHTVVIVHNDTRAMILALDAWIVLFDTERSPAPYTTTTTTVTAPTPTPTGSSLTASDNHNSFGINGTVAGNPDTSTADSPRSYSAIIIGTVVPILFLIMLCVCGFCIYRNRRTRNAQRRRESFREKLFRRQPSPLTLGKRAEATGVLGARGHRRSTDDARAMSPHTFASTRYSTALDHMYEMDDDINGRTSPAASPPVAVAAARNPPVDLLDAHALSAGMDIGNGSNDSSFGISPALASSTMRPSPATFDPPAEWRTTLTSVPGPSSNHPVSLPSDILTPAGAAAIASGSGTGTTAAAARARRDSQSGTDAYRGLRNDPKPSTVFSETDSGHSLGGLSPASRFYQQPGLINVPDVNPTTPPTPVGNARPTSVLHRFSTALASTLRGNSRPNSSRYSNNFVLGGVNQGNDQTPNATQNEDDLENNRGGYFRGINHFNLGIPLNYRPTATAAPSGYNSPSSPMARSPTTQTGPPLNPQSQGFEWGGSGTGGSNNGDTYRSRSTPAPTTPGSALNQLGGPFEDFAFSTYTRQTRERVFGVPIMREADRERAVSTARSKSEEEVIEPEEKEDKILEGLDGDTMQGGETEDEGGWSVGHGTLASRGGAASSSGASQVGVTRHGSSVSRQRSILSNADQGRQVIPPPYSVYIPPDTKTMPPPGS